MDLLHADASSMSNPDESVTQFLNVDLELVSTNDLGPLLAHLSDATFTLRDSVDGGRRTVWMELARDPPDADGAIRDFTSLVESLPPDLRGSWNTCEDRCLNVGVQAGLAPHASAFRISANAITALAATSTRLEFTVYAAETESKPRNRKAT